MKRFYLVRHGETDWNKYNKVQGSIDTDLNETGIEQAKKIAERLKDEKIDIIFSSTLKRAYLTAYEIKSFHPEIPLKLTDKLNEINFGEWEGLSFEELEKRYSETYKLWKESPDKTTFPGEGSLYNVMERIKSFFEEILNESYSNVVIVTHGGIIKLAIIYLLELPLDFYKKCWIGNASLSIVDIKEKSRMLSLLNDMSHLQSIQRRPII
ncbi:histidine phosphatase family protein [Caldicellulosiruptor naganoensis]|uniref:Histidine phosphatase family protein n=1 Tax=Caldicellulosiruptor naganoensis TaxID=29324 RepID=A0ABY7BCU2_9FIRM|nr:histidine phosphatase family protein [Caldicellulosiruptor naganoensis]WAM30642.1 histidine phosphatase family protein [Caldicellulosiruptor naganoensis]